MLCGAVRNNPEGGARERVQRKCSVSPHTGTEGGTAVTISRKVMLERCDKLLKVDFTRFVGVSLLDEAGELLRFDTQIKAVDHLEHFIVGHGARMVEVELVEDGTQFDCDEQCGQHNRAMVRGRGMQWS